MEATDLYTARVEAAYVSLSRPMGAMLPSGQRPDDRLPVPDNLEQYNGIK